MWCSRAQTPGCLRRGAKCWTECEVLDFFDDAEYVILMHRLHLIKVFCPCHRSSTELELRNKSLEPAPITDRVCINGHLLGSAVQCSFCRVQSDPGLRRPGLFERSVFRPSVWRRHMGEPISKQLTKQLHATCPSPATACPEEWAVYIDDTSPDRPHRGVGDTATSARVLVYEEDAV